MTVYALQLDQVHQTIRDTLADRVLPSVESGSARGEILAIIEMLDNLGSRLAWESGSLTGTASRTRALGAALGQVPAVSEGDVSVDDVAALRATRQSISQVLASAYAGGLDPAVVSAVAQFTTDDVNAEISKALRPGLPA